MVLLRVMRSYIRKMRILPCLLICSLSMPLPEAQFRKRWAPLRSLFLVDICGALKLFVKVAKPAIVRLTELSVHGTTLPTTIWRRTIQISGDSLGGSDVHMSTIG